MRKEGREEQEQSCKTPSSQNHAISCHTWMQQNKPYSVKFLHLIPSS